MTMSMWRMASSVFSRPCHGDRGVHVLNQPGRCLARAVTYSLVAGAGIGVLAGMIARSQGTIVIAGTLLQLAVLGLGASIAIAPGQPTPRPEPDLET